jgi:hypothetical protein
MRFDADQQFETVVIRVGAVHRRVPDHRHVRVEPNPRPGAGEDIVHPAARPAAAAEASCAGRALQAACQIDPVLRQLAIRSFVGIQVEIAEQEGHRSIPLGRDVMQQLRDLARTDLCILPYLGGAGRIAVTATPELEKGELARF